MDKREALKTLINESSLFSDEEKIKMIQGIEHMSDEEVENLGKALAVEMKLKMGEETNE